MSPTRSAIPDSGQASPRFDVLVLGAGISGLACARSLVAQGLSVCVVEAASRIGGRIATTHVGDRVVELGAEFVHGRPQDLLDLIQEAGLTLCERGGSQLSFDGHHLHEGDDDDARFAPLEDLRTLTGLDLSFRDYLDRLSVSPEVRASLLGYVEGFNASDAGQISALSLGRQQAAEDEIDGDRVAHLREGYDRLPRFLADRILAGGGSLHLDRPVTAVHWGVDRVAFETAQGELVASQAVLTLPLGVLQAGTVAIVPEPRALLEAAARMRMGPVCRFTMVFRQRFWEALPPQPAMRELSFLFDLDQLPSVWWSTHPEGGRSLTAWVGGPRAETLLHHTEAELADLGCRALARLFALPPSEVRGHLEACRSHNWSADPLARGSYSYVAVGGIDASAQMAQPVEHTLFFAGEHTDTTGHWGTVHGALRSGLRAASQVLAGR